jgi:hypothetical protein
VSSLLTAGSRNKQTALLSRQNSKLLQFERLIMLGDGLVAAVLAQVAALPWGFQSPLLLGSLVCVHLM